MDDCKPLLHSTLNDTCVDDTGPWHEVAAHNSPLAAVSLTPDGSMLATVGSGKHCYGS